MIKTFAVNDQPFSLVPDRVLQEPKLNIFSADSMTLLVGPNGSGKTRMLLSLAEATVSGDSQIAQIEWSDEDAARKTFTLYFTPIPYVSKISPSSRRFSALHPAKTRGKVSADVGTAIDLASAFGLDTLPSLTLSPYKRAMGLVKDLLFHPFRLNRPNYQLRDNWIAPLASLEAEQDNQEQRLKNSFRERGVGLAEMMATEEWHELRRSNASLKEEIFRRIEEQLGAEAILKIRALDSVRKAQPFTKNVKLELLSQLGLSVNPSPSKDQKKAKERFHDGVSRLRMISHALGGASLRDDEFRVSLEQWRTLASLDIQNLAELSVTRASSGSAALLDQFAKLKRAVERASANKNIRNLLLLIDEGDAFLHLEWQQKYVDFLDITVEKLWRKRFDSIQIVLTTHSPVLMSDFPKDCIHRLKKYSPDGDSFVDGRPRASFGAPLDTIIRSVGGAGTLGTFSTRVMRQLIDDIDRGLPIDEYQIEMIDDPIIRQHIKRILEANNTVLRRYAD